MSHFTCLVATRERPNQEIIEAALQPFHEVECTSVFDEYVQKVDITEEMLEEMKTKTKRGYRLASGEIVSSRDPRLFREPTREEMGPPGVRRLTGTGCGCGIYWESRDWNDGRGYRPKVFELPADAEMVEIPFDSLAEFVRYSHGDSVPILREGESTDGLYTYMISNESGDIVRVIKQTNPDAKWDWWTQGGRWSGQVVGPDDEARVGDLDLDTVSSFAMIDLEGRWLEKGEMGWFAVVSDEKEDWPEEQAEILRGLPKDAWLTLIDCHI